MGLAFWRRANVTHSPPLGEYITTVLGARKPGTLSPRAAAGPRGLWRSLRGRRAGGSTVVIILQARRGGFASGQVGSGWVWSGWVRSGRVGLGGIRFAVPHHFKNTLLKHSKMILGIFGESCSLGTRIPELKSLNRRRSWRRNPCSLYSIGPVPTDLFIAGVV